MQKPTLVVIPVLNEERTIGSIIRSLLDGLPAPNDLLIVVDGGSTDGTRLIVEDLVARHTNIRFVDNPKRIQSAGINQAVDIFGKDHDVLIRCDAHSEYPDDFISKLQATMENTGADSVVVPMDTLGVQCFQKAVAWISNSSIGTGGSAHRGGKKSGFVDHGHHAAMRLDKFREIGGYNSTFSHNEDAEFDCRLRAKGGKVYLDSAIRISYEPRGSFASLWRQYFNYGFGRSRTVRLHPDSLRIRQFVVPANLLAVILSIAFIPLSFYFLTWPLVYGLTLLSVSLVAAIEAWDRCNFLAGPIALTMHTAWALGFLSGFLMVREGKWNPSNNNVN